MAEPKHAASISVDEEMPQTGRLPEDDFFCLRYRVWYASLDCALRTRFRTAPGCLQCDQGRFNLRRHHSALAGSRFDLTFRGD